MKISIVICTYLLERLNDLFQALRSIDKQTYRNVEIIIVVDGNRKLYERIESRLPSLGIDNISVVFSEENRGLAHSRNLGIKHSNGDVVAFLDDDAFPDQYWLENIVNSYRSFPNAVGVGGKILPFWVSKKPDHLPRELYWIIGVTYDGSLCMQESNVRNTFGSNLCFRKKVFDSVGLFNEELGRARSGQVQGEETEFCIRVSHILSQEIIYNPKAIVYHNVNPEMTRWNFIIKRAFWQGYSKALISSLYPSNVLKTEKTYLKNLILDYYPRTLRMLPFAIQSSIKSLFSTTITIMITSIGYLYFKTRHLR